MADIELVIKISEEYYNVIKAIPDYQCTFDMLVIKNGKPLPEHHGDLVDRDAIDAGVSCMVNRILETPTIIEATDKEVNADETFED